MTIVQNEKMHQSYLLELQTFHMLKMSNPRGIDRIKETKVHVCIENYTIYEFELNLLLLTLYDRCGIKPYSIN